MIVARLSSGAGVRLAYLFQIQDNGFQFVNMKMWNERPSSAIRHAAEQLLPGLWKTRPVVLLESHSISKHQAMTEDKQMKWLFAAGVVCVHDGKLFKLTNERQKLHTTEVNVVWLQNDPCAVFETRISPAIASLDWSAYL